MSRRTAALVAATALWLTATRADACSCYSTNSTALGAMQFYTNYTFIDFRNISAPSGQNFTTAPPLVGDSQNDGSGDITTPYLSSDAFTSVFAIQNYTQPPDSDPSVASVALVNSAQNVYLFQDDANSPTYLTLRTARLDNFSSCGELDSAVTVLHASYRARARISGSSGACAGIFLYRNDTSESDIEILTRDNTTGYRATNQPDVDPDGNEIPGASTTDSPQGYSWENWNDYRLDWTPHQSAWYINGVLSDNKTYGIPRDAAMFMLNMWSNGGSWSGNMTVGDTAYLDVQWVEVVYNTTATNSNASNTCQSVCAVDQESQPGQPPQTSGPQTSTQTSGPQNSGALGMHRHSLVWPAVWLSLAMLVALR